MGRIFRQLTIGKSEITVSSSDAMESAVRIIVSNCYSNYNDAVVVVAVAFLA